jgi:hypothetical protein
MDEPQSVLERDLTLDIRPSKRFIAAITAVHAGGAVAVQLLDLTPWLRLMLAGAVMLAGLSLGRRYLQAAAGFASGLRLRVDGRFEVATVGGGVEASLVSADIVEPWLTVLVFRLPSKRRCAAILLADNVDPDAFRRLRARLRLGLWSRDAAQGGVPGAVS